ncbi:hypothetical protein MTR67_045535 [Solanum verrucosum]|uniref:Uncharacterized protein n=1 Tax=Solanum verrucosum TaxID=315347 RepID=A0AAF0USV2_SOLVR|nr:hypothetical protein MTR67_045535 [Solanum verrucosum]
MYLGAPHPTSELCHNVNMTVTGMTEFPLALFPPLALPFQQPLFSAPPPNPPFPPSVSDHSFLQDLNYESIILAEFTDEETNLKIPVSVHVYSDMTAVLEFDENPQRTEVDMCSQIVKDEALLAPLVGRDCVVPDEVEHFAFAENLSVESVVISNTISPSSELNSDLGDKTEETDMVNPHLTAFIVTSQLASAPSIFSVKLPSFLLEGQEHKLDMVFGCKVFDIKTERDTFATLLGPHTTIGSLPHALCLHICNWCDTGQVFWACFDKVNSSVYSVNRVLLFGYSKGETLLSVDDASDVCDVSSVTTTHKVFADMSDMYKYAYSFNLDSTRPYTESGSDIMIIDRNALLHKIKCLQLSFNPGVFVTHDVAIFFCDMCEDIRSVRHIEYPCISANHVVGAVSPSALEKYIDAYDFHQYLNFRNFNLSWQPYTDVAFSHGDNS